MSYVGKFISRVFDYRDFLNLCSLFIALFSFIYPEHIVDIIALYSLIDCYKNRIDMITHHIIVLYMYYLSKRVNFISDDKYYLICQLIKHEFSTLPLQIMKLMKKLGKDKGLIYKINQILFVFIFTYIRVINYPYQYLCNKDLHLIFNKYSIEYESFGIFITFYVLNLYWFKLILDKIVIGK